jgi:hypothetical protein
VHSLAHCGTAFPSVFAESETNLALVKGIATEPQHAVTGLISNAHSRVPESALCSKAEHLLDFAAVNLTAVPKWNTTQGMHHTGIWSMLHK